MKGLPTGTITLLFTDIQGSARLWEQSPEAMRAALARHDAIVLDAVEGHHGTVVRARGEGDSFFAVFARASAAVAAASDLQRALDAEAWPAPTSLRVRIAIHTGEADLREGDYYGSEVNRCARLRGLARGGQTLLSQAAADLVRRSLPSHLTLRPLGPQRLKDLNHPEHVYELLHAPAQRAWALRVLGASVRWALSPNIKGAVGAGGVLVILVFVLVIVTSSSRNVAPQQQEVTGTAAARADTPYTPQAPRPYARSLKPRSSVLHPGGILLELSVVDPLPAKGDPLHLVVAMRNGTQAVRTVSFWGEQLAEVHVRGIDGPHAGREIYRWPKAQLFTAKRHDVTWTPDQTRSFTLTWIPPRLEAAAGEARYRIHAVMLAEQRMETWLDVVVGDQ